MKRKGESIKLSILPFGPIPKEELNRLKTNLNTIFDFEIKILLTVPIPPSSYNDTRSQYEASPFLEIAKESEGDRVLGIVDADLFTLGLNFIFGQAEIEGKVAVISLYRLRFDASPKKFLERMIKEAVHEIGHTLGLTHCKDKFCVMHFSNCLLDTDIKSKNFCTNCRSQINTALLK